MIGPHLTTIQSTLKLTSTQNELYVEFDGQQLAIRSEAGEVLDFVAETYQSMLVPRVSASIGLIEIRRGERYYVALSDESPDFHADLALMFIYVRDRVQLHFIRARSDLLWLHAGAVARETKCLLISGPSGGGKSTLTTLLCERGWQLLSDELAPVRLDTLEVLPFPQQPIRRIYPGRDVSGQEALMLDRETVQVPDVSVHRDTASISGVVFPVFRGGSRAELVVLPPGEAALELVRNCTNFVDHKAVAVDAVSQLARAVPTHRLFYWNAAEAAQVLDGLA